MFGNLLNAIKALTSTVFKAPAPAPKATQFKSSQQLNLPKNIPIKAPAPKPATNTTLSLAGAKPSTTVSAPTAPASVKQQPAPALTPPPSNPTVSTPSSPPPAQIQQSMAKAVGSASAPQAVTSSLGATSGPVAKMPTSAIPGQNAALGIKGLTLPGVSPISGQSAQLAPTLPTRTPESMNRMQQNTGANTPQTQQTPQQKLADEIRMYGQVPNPTPVPPQNIQNVQNRVMQEYLNNQPKPAKNLIASLDTSKMYTRGALTTPEGKETTQANQKNLGASITDPTLRQHAITQAVQDPSKVQSTISKIASPEAQQDIVKMMGTAQKSGDMNTVRKLADMHEGITKQLQLIDQIGRAVLAQATGFGTPNTPGVTEVRMPMVEQAVGQQLTSPQMPQQSFNQAPVSGQAAQMMSPRLPSAPAQQNKPPLYPFMG